MHGTGPEISRHGLERHGLRELAAAHWNYGMPALFEEVIRRGEGRLADSGALVVDTGRYTGPLFTFITIGSAELAA